MKSSYIGSLILLSTSINAQDLNYHPIDPPTIYVTEMAERYVEPDEIFIRIEIKELDTKKDEKSIEQIESKLLSRLLETGIKQENIMLSDANSKFQNLNWFRKDIQSAERKYQIKINDITQLEDFYLSLDGLDIYNAYLSHVNYTKKDSIQRVLKREAAKAAKQEAKDMVEAVDSQLGTLLFISNGNQGDISVRGSRDQATYYYIDGVRVNAEVAKNKVPQAGIQHFEKIRFFESVTLRYAII